PVNQHHALVLGKEIVSRAKLAFYYHRNEIKSELSSFWDEKTKDFVNYWFSRDVQVALKSILNEIERVEDERLRDFFKLSFSAIIITKSGGVSLALDLAHTRPHRAAFAVDWNGNVVLNRKEVYMNRKRVCSKKIRSPFEEFERKFVQNLKSFLEIGFSTGQTDMFNLFEAHMERLTPQVSSGDAQNIPLDSSCVDLIVTSPPYASNAIDYMRAHKFSLVWFGYSIDDLTKQRKRYIGSEGTRDIRLKNLPSNTMGVIERLSSSDRKKGQDLHRYYSEMNSVISEVFRVLKPGGTAIFVVGDSKIRGQDAKIPECLSEIGESLGFVVPRIGVRQLDRNRRMMPAGAKIDTESQIQQRMHEEYVIGFYKPLETKHV
ncbi:MAG: DNA methyltransferase, partial [Roseiflexus sp.]